MRTLLILPAFLLVLLPCVASAKETREHPFVKPYEGSKQWPVEVTEYAEFELPTGPVVENKLKLQPLKGRLSISEYVIAKRSALEQYENYRQGVEKAGFEILFSCTGYKECGKNSRRKGVESIPSGAEGRYFVARRNDPAGRVWLAINISHGGTVNVVSIEEKTMETDKVQVTAEALQDDLSRTGHVAVYGLLFDSGKATLKPESTPVLQEIAKLFAKNPKLKLHVVGHTDSVGELAANLDLSKRRAEAVVKALVTDHKLPAAQLAAHGVASLVPVASNKAEEGRAMNRRVELVEQ